MKSFLRIMKQSFLLTILLVALFLVAGLNTEASAQIGVQAHAGLNIDGSELLIGGGVRVPINSLQIGGTPVEANPTIEFYPGVGTDGDLGGFDVDASYLVINLDGLYPLNLSESFDAYVGAGLYISRFSVSYDGPGSEIFDGLSSTDVGLNAIGGAMFGSGNLRPFAQAVLALGDGASGLILKGGIVFQLGD